MRDRIARAYRRIRSADSTGAVGAVLVAAVLVVSVGVAVTATGVLDPQSVLGSESRPDSPSESRTHGPPPDVEPDLHVRGGHANVSADGTVERLRLVLTKGDAAVDLSATSVTWVGPRDSASLVAETDPRATARSDAPRKATEPGRGQRFYISPIRDADGSFPVLNAEDDRTEFVVNATAVRGTPLTGGERVALKFTAPEGTVLYTVELPDSLERGETVEI